MIFVPQIWQKRFSSSRKEKYSLASFPVVFLSLLLVGQDNLQKEENLRCFYCSIVRRGKKFPLLLRSRQLQYCCYWQVTKTKAFFCSCVTTSHCQMTPKWACLLKLQRRRLRSKHMLFPPLRVSRRPLHSAAAAVVSFKGRGNSKRGVQRHTFFATFKKDPATKSLTVLEIHWKYRIDIFPPRFWFCF